MQAADLGGSQAVLRAFDVRGQHEVVLQLLQQDAMQVHSKDANGFTALHHVARKGNAALAKDLLRYRADVAAADLWGRSKGVLKGLGGCFTC